MIPHSSLGGFCTCIFGRVVDSRVDDTGHLPKYLIILARIANDISLQVVQVNNFLRQQFESTTSRVDLLRVDLDVDSC